MSDSCGAARHLISSHIDSPTRPLILAPRCQTSNKVYTDRPRQLPLAFLLHFQSLSRRRSHGSISQLYIYCYKHLRSSAANDRLAIETTPHGIGRAELPTHQVKGA